MSVERIRRAYVVDDDEAFRRSLVQLLESAGWTVEAFAAPAEFLGRAGELEPGLLLLDLNLPGQSGLDLLEGASAELDRFAVIMVTGAGAIQTAVRTIRAGAMDFIEKPFRAAELFGRLDAIEVRLGETLRAKSDALAARQRIEALSPRERDVLERLLGGASNKLVARALDLSPRTVEMHRARMLQKLGLATTAEALVLARSAGLKPISA